MAAAVKKGPRLRQAAYVELVELLHAARSRIMVHLQDADADELDQDPVMQGHSEVVDRIDRYLASLKAAGHSRR